MIKRLLLLNLAILLTALPNVFSQPQPLTYFLPDITYDPAIPTPEAFFGHQIGEWHLSHDKQYAYMRELARLSPRVQLVEHGRTYEQRPLIHLIITSEANQQRLEEIRSAHVKLSDPAQSAQLATDNMPLVLYQGFSIHGNEPSGANAAPLVAYYLAAGQGPEVERILNEVVVIFDPSFNPDGLQRFSTWVNMHKNLNITGDSQDREYNEPWPRGRTNHYWFDLNRDWLMMQHPESRGRVTTFHEWKPNILTDHHEMGTNSTFFFMPGEPNRTNPITPRRNQELTKKIGTFHAAALDKIGSLYYSEEGYDDFYYGKGSTYPDANGCIGILFEQASSRGHLQETDNGELAFAFTIRNQVTTALSTYRASVEMRRELLDFQRDFYKEALAEARRDTRKAFVFGEPFDRGRLAAFVEILRRNQIQVHRLARRVEAGGTTFEPATSYVVPLEQTQYRTVRGIFDTTTVFEDSLFYDISAWTLPLAFNIPYAALQARQYTADLLGAPVEGLGQETIAPTPAAPEYAYVFEWDDYYAPRAAQYLLKNGLRLKVAMKEFTLDGHRYLPGTIVAPVSIQDKGREELFQLMQIAARATGVTIQSVKTGLTPDGIDLGSRNFEALHPLKTMIVVGDGANSNEAGEAWHLLDQRIGVAVSKVEGGDLARADLSRYNTIVMVDGSYTSISAGGIDQLKSWVQNGGVLVLTKGAVRWAKDKGLAYVTLKEDKDAKTGQRPYDKIQEDRAATLIEGAIFEVALDLTHPLAFGYRRDRLPVFRDHTLFLEPGTNAYATPLRYSAKPLLSGYINKANTAQLANSAAAVVTGMGAGKVICLADNPNFRAFWYGTNKVFLNALFFGHTISNGAREPRPKE